MEVNTCAKFHCLSSTVTLFSKRGGGGGIQERPTEIGLNYTKIGLGRSTIIATRLILKKNIMLPPIGTCEDQNYLK